MITVPAIVSVISLAGSSFGFSYSYVANKNTREQLTKTNEMLTKQDHHLQILDVCGLATVILTTMVSTINVVGLQSLKKDIRQLSEQKAEKVDVQQLQQTVASISQQTSLDTKALENINANLQMLMASMRH